MPYIKIVLIIVLLVGYYFAYVSPKSKEGFRSTKCFSCEAQDHAQGIMNRGYGTKCFSCERESNLPHPNKCFSCERGFYLY